MRRPAVGRNLVLAIFLSLLVHALAAVVMAVGLACASGPDVLAQLDLSSVELSFSDDAETTTASAPSPLAAVADPPVRPRDERVPEAKCERPRPPDPPPPRGREPAEPVASLPADSARPLPSAPASPPSAVQQARVDAPPRPRQAFRPEYPRGARRRGEQGTVTVEIRVRADGTVESVAVVASSGFAELDAAAVRAARTAKFAPARSGTSSVASTVRLPLSFRLK